jgi:hypothetical protein
VAQKELDVESVARATRVGWLVIAVIACAFSYSLGFQFGYSDAAASADQRMVNVNDSLREIIRASDDATAAAADATAHARSSPEAAATF